MHERDPNHFVIQVIVWALLLVPAVPLGLAWAAVRRGTVGTGGRARTQRVMLTLMSVSQSLLVAGFLWAEAIGTDYTDRRFVTTWVNLTVMAVSTAVAACVRGGVRLELVTAGVFLTFAWFYVAVMSAVGGIL